MDGVASRRGLSLSAAVAVAGMLALCATLLPAGRAAAQSSSSDSGSPSGDGSPADAETSAVQDLLPLGDFPGKVGQIVQQLGDQKVPTRRYRGAQRFETARLIAMDAFDTPTDAVIARGDLFPDALSGSFLAGQLEAPLLLTSSHRLEPDTQSTLQDLDADNVTLIGGDNAISPAVEDTLREQGYATDRVGGEDRFETAAMVASNDDAEVGQREGHGPTAIVARADEFADALVAGTLSYTADFPLLLTTADELHPDTAEVLQQQSIEHVIVPGGSGAVSDDVVSQIEDKGIDVKRVAGVDRVATSVNFAEFMRDEFGFGLDRINTARGTRFADALALGPLSGPTGQPVILTADKNTLGGDGTVQEFLSQTCSIDTAGLGGGHAAITPELANKIREIATSTGAPCNLDLVPKLASRDLGGQHTVTSTLTDNAGTPLQGEDVRTEVYRADDLGLPSDLSALEGLDLSNLQDAVAGLPADQILATLQQRLSGLGLDNVTFGSEPVETFTGTTDAQGEVDASWTGPESPAMDVAVSCLDAESESCVLTNNGQLPDASTVEPDPNLLTGSGTVLWGLDALDLLPNLLLVEPPLDVNDTGTQHSVTVSALLANLGSGGQNGVLSDLPDLDALGDTGGVLAPGGIGQLGGLLDGLSVLSGVDGANLDGANRLSGVSALGRPVPDTQVRLEVYRLTENLPTGLLDGLVGLAGSSSEGDLDQSSLLDVLGGQNVDGVLADLSLQPVHTDTDRTDSQGQATFAYDGPSQGLGLDLIVACFGGPDDRCLPEVGGSPELPDDPSVGVAASLWSPGDLSGLLDGLVGQVDQGLLTDLADQLGVSVDELTGLLGDQNTVEQTDGDLIDAALDETLDTGQVLSVSPEMGADTEAGASTSGEAADGS